MTLKLREQGPWGLYDEFGTFDSISLAHEGPEEDRFAWDFAILSTVFIEYCSLRLLVGYKQIRETAVL